MMIALLARDFVIAACRNALWFARHAAPARQTQEGEGAHQKNRRTEPGVIAL
jgi:hypothetical protein